MTHNISPLNIDELKKLIFDAAEKIAPPDGLDADEALFGNDSRLALDSIDALQISMAIQQRYGVRLSDSKETRRALGSVNLLAEFLNLHIRAE
jgi:acyl carrier protein